MPPRNVAQKYYVRQLLGQSEESIRDAWAKVGFRSCKILVPEGTGEITCLSQPADLTESPCQDQMCLA